MALIEQAELSPKSDQNNPGEQVSRLFEEWKEGGSPEVAEDLSFWLRRAQRGQKDGDIELTLRGVRELPRFVDSSSDSGNTIVRVNGDLNVRLDMFPLGKEEMSTSREKDGLLKEFVPPRPVLGLVISGEKGNKEEVIAWEPDEVLSLRCLY